LVIQGPDAGRQFRPADGKPLVIGRASDDLPLTDYTVSRRHAELRASGHGWNLEDLKSANGTYLNGKRVERPTRLRDGDRIRMGSTVLVWDGSEDKSSAAAATTPASTADLIDLDAGGPQAGSPIIGAVAGGDDSIILASPAAAEAVRSWRVISALLEAVGSVLTPHQLAERVMDILFEEVPVDHGFIFLKDDKGHVETEVVRAGPDQPPEKTHASRQIVRHVIQKHEAILSRNTLTDARFSGLGGDDSVQAVGLLSVICAPLVAREEILGVIYLDCAMAKHIYAEEQLRLVAAIGRMAGLAIEDARLVHERVRVERLAATGETAARVSHSMKNILQGVMGAAEVVRMGLHSQSMPTVEQGWQIVQDALDRIYALAMDMLAFAKRREPRKEPVQLAALLTNILKLSRRRAETKGVMLRGDLGEAMPAVPVDENGIHQALLNIVTNAIEAAPATSGVVNVKAGYEGEAETVVVTVGDNGPGISEKDRDRVFDPFYSTKGQGGTGLGLTVARKIVEEHGGRIEITSVEGAGTLIRVTLPAVAQTDLDSAETHGPGPPPPLEDLDD
jgi:signal transduction histidine kinase